MANKKKTSTYSEFRKAATFLKQNVELSIPLKIRRIKLSSMDGYCQKQQNCFYIAINRELNEEHSIDVLLHEVAHAMSWDKDKDEHGPSWGLSYSKVYRKFLYGYIDA